jgi:alkanesulfonate monooxygenase SsuD/methylene tetrahydromethanopterin reductase-like flavin-dependent oxidoreductase (luciferase family)
MHIGMSLSPFGHHPAAWRKKVGAPAELDATYFAAQVKKAENAALDFVLFADVQALRPTTELSPQAIPFEPTTLVAALSTLARRIGFIATAATAQHELYNLARRFASLDLISQGRVGWNLVASQASDAWNAEYVAVVGALWDSWDDDAFVYDKAAGRFFTWEKMHVLEHRGEHFTVRGPLNVNRSPQGRPIITHLLTPQTMTLAAHSAEVLFLTSRSLEEGGALAAQLRGQLGRHGRDRSDLRVLANVIPWIGTTAAQARDVFDELNSLTVAGSAQRPEGCDVIGTALEIADALQEGVERHEFDGFTILPPVAPGGLDAFVEQVVPELRRRGLFRAGYEGSTLRDHLALARPRQPAATA